MAEPFLSEIRIVSFSFPPKGWALCNGQLMPILQNQALFSLLGTTFGGDGRDNFALPDLRGRVPIHAGGGHTLGERAGAESVTLSSTQIPQHTHTIRAISGSATTNDPSNAALASSAAVYHAPASLVNINPGSVSQSGGSQPHTNLQPFLVLNFCIALQGIFPSPN
jgi:microcystin-dependent protein